MLLRLKETYRTLPFQLGCILFCLLLAVYAGWSLFTRVQTMIAWKEKITEVEAKLPLLETAAIRDKELASTLHNADPHYLERYLSSIRLARLEAYSLETHKTELTQNQAARLKFLMGEENTLHFTSGKTAKGHNSLAVEMRQENPVEVDEKDIQKILAHIEGVPLAPYAPAEHRPPMLIKKFSLKRKKETKERFPSYLLDMELWRKEALPSS